MKLIVPFSLCIVVGLIVATGCVTTTTKHAENTTTTITITPTVTTPGSGVNKTANTTSNSTSVSNLKGSLRVSISGILNPANLTVILDNETVGAVSPANPLYLITSEGNHTVMVCMDSVCEQESVMTKFGTYVTVDFSDRVKKNMKFPNPLARPDARILDYFKNGNGISVHVEFINPSKEDLMMMASVSCGYSYIDDRTSFKMGDSAKGKLLQNVKAGQRVTATLDLYFVSGRSYSFDIPAIDELTIK
ncbi:MAG TPA: hypothetical protein VFC43_02240 [Methanoregula sp.]|nr:hypothetical protein [Methanoregula sp.]